MGTHGFIKCFTHIAPISQLGADLLDNVFRSITGVKTGIAGQVSMMRSSCLQQCVGDPVKPIVMLSKCLGSIIVYKMQLRPSEASRIIQSIFCTEQLSRRDFVIDL
ncbi:hypothetical protein CVE34_06605 [Pseudomonas syringae pv. actinidiae]|uniref:Uncharacterized conserved protein YicC n=2 Tax=Pseudomonas syringae group TaxID=136849 RepID=A0A2G7PUB7_PSESF|nr:hypothetical protein NZ708_20405 [Pseudomonas syringae pv. actinidiae ICMP 18708]APP99158.1 hypothetical protein PsaNZ45_20955 [Pseudomonas syringae pv. actinidiae]OZI83286.1 hypothetical protein CFN58_32400 [Pseudomonas avellanae]APQ04918.1 hypothetical protein PsaNZ47_20395 [Pseudomonas syringae pv. actinidiae]ATV20850.1 hypothetical protein CT122_08945 [Pseudomonas syringae pv. actinidiae]